MGVGVKSPLTSDKSRRGRKAWHVTLLERGRSRSNVMSIDVMTTLGRD